MKTLYTCGSHIFALIIIIFLINMKAYFLSFLIAVGGWICTPNSLHAQQSPDCHIGNFFFSAPNGIAFIKNNAAAFVIDPIWDNDHIAVVGPGKDGSGWSVAHLGGRYNAGVVAPDDSYHKIFFEMGNNQLVTYEWARVGENVVGRLTPEGKGLLYFSLEKNWPGFKSHYKQVGNTISGTSDIKSGNIKWTLQAQPSPIEITEKGFKLQLIDHLHPTYFTAGFGTLPKFEDIDTILKEAEYNYETNRPKAISGNGDIIGAITNNLNNSRLYSNNDHKTFIVVSRSFGVNNANQGPAFCWDNFFNGLMSTLDNPQIAKETFRSVLSTQLPNGMIRGVSHWSMGPSTGNSQPPVGSFCIWKAHQYRPDVEFLKEAYPHLVKWHEWWMKYRNVKKDGLLQWGSEDRNFQNAMYETGWDDTPHFAGTEGVRMEGTCMNVYAVDLCALWAMDAEYLSYIAKEIGKHEDAAKFAQESKDMNKRINEKLWNEKLGIYCSRFIDNPDGTPGKFLTRLAPLNFYPLISGAASKQQAERMLAIMRNPEYFWGDYILPTIARNDPAFAKQRYWSGNIWGPANYLVFQGLQKYASNEMIAEYAQKSVRLFMNNWLGAGLCGENFFSTNGRVSNNPNYTWGALLCLIGLESIIDTDEEGNLVKGPGYNEPVTLKNIPFGGTLYQIELKTNQASVNIKKQ